MKKTIGIATGVIALGIGAVLFLASPESPAQTAQPSLEPGLPIVSSITVSGYQLVKEKRVSRTESELTYKIVIRNSGDDTTNVILQLTSVANGLTAIDSDVAVGFLAGRSSTTSVDTFSVRQDRTKIATVSGLVWAAHGEAIPVDSGIVTIDSLSLVEFAGRQGHEGLFPVQATISPGSVVTARISFTGRPATITLSLKSLSGAQLTSIGLSPYLETDSISGDYIATFVMPSQTFRITAQGTDIEGRSFSSTWQQNFGSPQAVGLVLSSGSILVPPGGDAKVNAVFQNDGKARTVRVVAVSNLSFASAAISQPVVQVEAGQSITIPIVVSASAATPNLVPFQVKVSVVDNSTDEQLGTAQASGEVDAEVGI